VSVISFPFRDHGDHGVFRPRIATAPRRSTVSHRGTARFRLWARLSWTGQLVVITAVGAVAAMFVVQSIDTRQVALAHVQDQLLTAQSQYAAAVSQITKNASPEHLASKVGGSNLVVPTSVSQILRVSLDVPVAVPHVRGGYAISRVLQDSHVPGYVSAPVTTTTHSSATDVATTVSHAQK
jgi:hypothetical protein